MSTLNKRIKTYRDMDVVSEEDPELLRENERLRKENRILREEREVLKKQQSIAPSHGLFHKPLPVSGTGDACITEMDLRGEKVMRFDFMHQYQGSLSQGHLCKLLNVTSRGYRSWCGRPASRRQRGDMVLLAHIREQHRLCLNSYGRPRMTEELKELGLNVGHRRVGRLMRQNNISVVRTRKHQVTTDSNHKFNIAPNLLNRNLTANQPNQKWPLGDRWSISVISGPLTDRWCPCITDRGVRAGCIWPLFWVCIHGVLSAPSR